MIGNIGGPATLIFIGALISATGAIWASIEQSKSEKALREKSDEIAELNKEISKSITGGDSFVYISPSHLTGSDFPESLMIVHQGKHPIYDLSIRVVDVDDFNAELAKPEGHKNLLNVGVNSVVGNISPNTAAFSGISMKEKENTKLTIQFNARNGHFSEVVHIRKVGDQYKTALKVSKFGESSDQIFEKVDEGFPLNDRGEVEW